MSTLVGFKTLKIAVHKPDGSVKAIHEIKGNKDKGGMISAEIEGLSSEPVKVYASNRAYYVVQKGVGDVSATLSALDMPETVEDEILGYEQITDGGFTVIGENTEPPFCSILMESEDLRGNKALLGLFKGKFSRDGFTLETKTNENVEPEGTEYTFSAVTTDKEGFDGQVFAKYVGSETSTITALETAVIGTVTP